MTDTSLLPSTPVDLPYLMVFSKDRGKTWEAAFNDVHIYHGKSPVHAGMRKAVSMGLIKEDDYVAVIDHKRTPIYNVATAKAFTKHAVRENEKVGPTLRKYKPFEMED